MKSLAEVEEAISSSILLRPCSLVLPHAPLLRSPAPGYSPSAPFKNGLALFPRPKWSMVALEGAPREPGEGGESKQEGGESKQEGACYCGLY